MPKSIICVSKWILKPSARCAQNSRSAQELPIVSDSLPAHDPEAKSDINMLSDIHHELIPLREQVSDLHGRDRGLIPSSSSTALVLADSVPSTFRIPSSQSSQPILVSTEELSVACD